MTPSGRFAHRKEYVASVGEAHHLELMHYESLDGFRHEVGSRMKVLKRQTALSSQSCALPRTARWVKQSVGISSS